MKIITIIFFLFTLIAASMYLLQKPLLAHACTYNQGKWAKTSNSCIHRDCAKNNSCKPSYNNNDICTKLKTGIEKNELFFHLGMPIQENETTYIFQGGGGQKNIKAIIEDQKVKQLECNF